MDHSANHGAVFQQCKDGPAHPCIVLLGKVLSIVSHRRIGLRRRLEEGGSFALEEEEPPHAAESFAQRSMSGSASTPPARGKRS